MPGGRSLGAAGFRARRVSEGRKARRPGRERAAGIGVPEVESFSLPLTHWWVTEVGDRVEFRRR